MSDNKFALIVTIGVICGVCFGFFGSSYTSQKYNFPNVCRVDTIQTNDTIRDTIYNSPDTIVNIPSIFTTSSNNIVIDSIKTVVNGEVTNSDIRISIKDTKNIKTPGN